MRRCNGCGLELDEARFKADSECQGGRRSTCRLCTAAERIERDRQLAALPVAPFERKILFFDLETDGVEAFHADLAFVVCFGYKWEGDAEASILTIERDALLRDDDSKLCADASALFEEADMIVAHYGDRFDRRFLAGRLLINGLPPIPPTKMFDTWDYARRHFSFRSNRLQNIADVLGLGNRKYHKQVPDEWPGWWHQVMHGNMEALAKMAEYCKQDVETLQEIYWRIAPHVGAGGLTPVRMFPAPRCRICGGKMEGKGVTFVGENRYRRIQCTVCHKWDRERTKL